MFWFPEKPLRIYSVDKVPKDYVMQVKKDGWRIETTNINGKLELFNRYGDIITCAYESDWKWIEEIFGKGFYLDGEVIGQRQAGILTDTIVVWDLLYYDLIGMHKLSYSDRYNKLHTFSSGKTVVHPKAFGTELIDKHNGFNLLLTKTYSFNEFPEVWKRLEIDSKYDEGVVFKNGKAPLKWSLSGTVKTANQLKLKIRE